MSKSWPPKVEALRQELGRKPEDTADDDLLKSALAAAISFVQRVHQERYNFGDAPLLSAPDDDMHLGTLYLARRLHSRRRSPDGVIDLGELGSTRIPSFDPDIDRLLQIGRYSRMVFG
jgi:hypothetical protein